LPKIYVRDIDLLAIETNNAFMAKNRILMIVSAFLAFTIITSGAPAIAIYGGTPATGNPIVVGLLNSQTATLAACSGALVAPRVVMTASHCLTRPAESVWVSAPGTDLRDKNTLRIQGEKYFIPTTFSMSSFPHQNDFGIIILKSSFPNTQVLEIANLEEVSRWMSEESSVMHLGYGCTALVESPPCGITSPTPNQITTVFSNEVPTQFSSLVAGTFSVTKISVDKTICGGDSGSPILKEVSGKIIYVGAQSSSNGAGCTKTCNIVCVATQGLPGANVELVESAFRYVATVVPTPIPTRATGMQAAKKTTIFCTKGKLTKKITGVKPICPSGYKKK
jgi:secreted trypsin-like serine protease